MFDNIRKAVDAKPCPFCGRERIITFTRAYYERQYASTGSMAMECQYCGAELWSHPRKEMEYEAAYLRALMKWNRRVTK